MKPHSVTILLPCLLAVLVASANVGAKIRKADANVRIVGGNLTTIDKVPYAVQLRVWGQFFCGGTLVSPLHVVSAAHCLKATAPENIVVVGGATTIADAGVQRIIVATHVHPLYDITLPSSTHDIVVFKLNAPMKADNIATVPLCSEKIPPNQLLQVSGWGYTSAQSLELSFQVRSTRVPVFTRAECAKRYAGIARISESMFCASSLGRRDACKSDSGGPGMYGGELCGVVSWGSGCASEHFPGVYTDVFLLRQWIEEKMAV